MAGIRIIILSGTSPLEKGIQIQLKTTAPFIKDRTGIRKAENFRHRYGKTQTQNNALSTYLWSKMVLKEAVVLLGLLEAKGSIIGMKSPHLSKVLFSSRLSGKMSVLLTI